MKVWSLTMFNDELDVLEIRLGTLEGVVDRHVLVEAPVTHSGQPKPLYFEENWERFARWDVEHYVVELPGRDVAPSNYRREALQRMALDDGCEEEIEPDDLLLITDLDEIPDPQTVRDLREGRLPVPCAIQMPMFMYRLNWRWYGLEPGFTTARVFRGAALQGTSMQWLRTKSAPVLDGPRGWHLAYQGDADWIRAKIEAIADTWVKENPDWRDREHLERCIATGADLFGREERRSYWVPDNFAPPYALAQRERFAHMFIPRPGARP